MLHREKVTAALEKIAPQLFQTNTDSLMFLRDEWIRFSAALDTSLIDQKLKDELLIQLPLYAEEKLSLFYPVEPATENYICAAVDGSQIYPSRHDGVSVALLNIGTVILEYNNEQGLVSFESTPHIQQEFDTLEYAVETQTIVDAERLNLELQQLIHTGRLLKKKQTPFLLLIDGPLIFWNLVTQPTSFAEQYFNQYIRTLTDSVTERLPLLCYTSKSHSRDYVRSLLLFLKHTKQQFTEHCPEYKKITDAALLSDSLPPWHRTAFLMHRTPFTLKYPSELAVYFTYLRTDHEIARVELPQWIVRDRSLSTKLLTLLAHQIKNGFGYPTTAALAHEQAVIKTADRIFFINLLQHYAAQYGDTKQNQGSQKELRKKLADAINRETF